MSEAAQLEVFPHQLSSVLHSRAFLHGAVRILHTSICVDYFCQGTVEKDQEERCSLFTEQQLQEPLGHHREL